MVNFIGFSSFLQYKQEQLFTQPINLINRLRNRCSLLVMVVFTFITISLSYLVPSQPGFWVKLGFNTRSSMGSGNKY